MTSTQKIISYGLGSAAVALGGAFVGVFKTEWGFRSFLDIVYGEREDIISVEPADLARELEADRPPLLLDARTPEEYSVSHLRNAQLANPATFDFDELYDVDRDRAIVAYGSIGNRSHSIVERLREQGFTNVRTLYGGIFLWYNQGRPVYRGSTLVDQIHPYNWFWALFLTRGDKRSVHPHTDEVPVWGRW
jgi:rhodanese-related sulfurtransferase